MVSLQPKQQAVVVLMRAVQPILIRQKHPEYRAKFQQLMPVLARVGQAAHLDPENQPHVVQTHLGE